MVARGFGNTLNLTRNFLARRSVRVGLWAVISAGVASAGCMRTQSGSQSAQVGPASYQGANYLPSTTNGICNALSLLSADPNRLVGTFDALQIEAEIAKFAEADLRVLRIFPSFYGWLADSADYMANLKSLCQSCANHGVRITYVMWNTTSNVFFPMYQFVDPAMSMTDSGLLTALRLVATTYSMNPNRAPLNVVRDQFGDPWQWVLLDEPSNELFDPPFDGVMASWPNNLGAKCEAYVDAIGGFFANDPDGRAAYASYDLFNESDCCNLTLASEAELYRMTYRRLARQHAIVPGSPAPEFTAGFADYRNTRANHDFLVSIGVKLTYLSYHCYEARPLFTDVARDNALVGAQLGMPVVCSEFYDRNRPGHLGSLGGFCADLNSFGIGATMWGYLATNIIIEVPAPQGVIPPPPPDYRRIDGLWLPTTSPLGSFSSIVEFELAAQSARDLRALSRW